MVKAIIQATSHIPVRCVAARQSPNPTLAPGISIGRAPASGRLFGLHFARAAFICQQGQRAQDKDRSRVVAMASNSKSVLVPVANGSEEMETVIIVDTLRRAGADVTVASVESGLQVEMSRKVKLVADALIGDVSGQTFDLIAVPGGMPGAQRLADSAALAQLLQQQAEAGRFVTAICAAPAVVLEAGGLLKGKRATAHPAFVERLADQSAADTRVVVDGKVITSRGPGTSLEFALSLVHALFGKEKADEVAKPMVVSPGLQY